MNDEKTACISTALSTSICAPIAGGAGAFIDGDIDVTVEQAEMISVKVHLAPEDQFWGV